MVDSNRYLAPRNPNEKPPVTIRWRTFVDLETSKWRYSQCLTCPRLNSMKFCRECGCFMPAKTKLAAFDCPLGKWPAESNYLED